MMLTHLHILFINSFLQHDYAMLKTKLQVVLIVWLVVLAAVIIDLITGISKARKLGEARTSYGFRRTVVKMLQYYGLMFFAFMFDVLASIIAPLPYFTALGGLFLLFIEGKSVMEKAHDKDRRKVRNELEHLLTLLENKDDFIKGVTELLKKQVKKNDNS